jgi:membrane glycosyltransferase
MSARPLLHPSQDSEQRLLAMPDQDFRRPFRDPAAPRATAEGLTVAQLLVIAGPAALSLALGWLLLNGVLGTTTFSASAIILVAAAMIPFYWDAVASALSLAGLFWKSRPPAVASQSLRIAVLVLLYDENAEPILERSARLLDQLQGNGNHIFNLHVLSDSRKPGSVLREQSAFDVLQRRHPMLQLAYRNRLRNDDYKSGNIRDWIRSTGHMYDAMVVLDADSMMAPASVLQMADALAGDASCGIVQSVPKVMAGPSLWQKMQSHASHVVGANLGKGLAVFSGGTANYYGHNAMLRIKAFAASAGLPHLKGDAPFGGVIMSHDFVEAALLCRAGWNVRMVPEAGESFEETPATLMGFLARDRRWCHGNMQHLLLLKVRGLRYLSRYHLLQGAMTYLNAPLWLIAVGLWMLVPEIRFGLELSIALAIVVSTLLLPRIVGWFQTAGTFSLSFAVKELVLSSLLAPSLIMQRTRMILSIVFGRSFGWTKTTVTVPSFATLLKFHAIEIAVGTGLFAIILQGSAALWLVPVAASLVMSPVLAGVVSGTRWRTSHEDHQ